MTKEPEQQRRKGSYGVKLVRGPLLKLQPHELACESEDELLALAPTLEGPLAADLFSGAGGLSLGLTEAGYQVVLAVDHDEEALQTHRANHPGLSVNWDLGDEDVVERVADLVRRTGVELIAGGPPCQPFSRAGRSMIRELVKTGRRPKHDRRRDLWESFLRIIELAQPKAVLMENVPDMALDRGMVILRTMIERLEGAGYSVDERVVDTWRYGVPQFRQRLILVALQDGVDFIWPDEAEDRVTVDGAVGDLPPVLGGWRPSNGDGSDVVASGWAEYSGPLTAFQRRAREQVPTESVGRIYDHITRPVRDDDALAFASMDHTTRYSDLDDELKRYREDIFEDKYKRLDPNDVSRTITAHIAKDGYWYIHPYQDRTITVREAARLQTFPDHIRFAGPPSAAFRQIGNAVPPLLGERLGIAIMKSLADARHIGPSTGLIAEELAGWWAEFGARRLPWLEATNRWAVLQSEILWSRVSDDSVRRLWSAVQNLCTPSETLAAEPLLRLLARQVNRERRCDLLIETAKWFEANPDSLELSATAGQIAAAPNVTQAMADLATRVIPGESEDPVLANFGVLRVAARFQGQAVDRRNRLSDGRLAIARMIGGDETSHGAHLALIELANGICGPQRPSCNECPLEPWCLEAAGTPVQTSLPGVTSRAKRRPRAKSVLAG